MTGVFIKILTLNYLDQNVNIVPTKDLALGLIDFYRLIFFPFFHNSPPFILYIKKHCQAWPCFTALFK
jgi:hypothetical protein